MRVDTRTTIKDYEGKPFPTEKDPLTVLQILDTALNGNTNTETPTAEDKSKRYQLSIKLYKSKEIDLTVDEMALLKERVNKIYPSPLICGRIADLFEGKTQEVIAEEPKTAETTPVKTPEKS